jgi:hypothetical protein
VLIIKGAGPWSVDGWLAGRRAATRERQRVGVAA